MSNQGPAANRFSVARSSRLITVGAILVVVGWALRVVAGDAAADTEGAYLQFLVWLGFLVILAGAATAITGFAYLSSNLDYVAAREAERHRLTWKQPPDEGQER